jgi:hypothetical protein
MPRKPKPPPVILQVEDIATGRVISEDSFQDDFGPERIAMQVQPKPSRGLPIDAQDYRDAVNRAKRAEAKALLDYAFNPPQPKPFKRRI